MYVFLEATLNYKSVSSIILVKPLQMSIFDSFKSKAFLKKGLVKIYEAFLATQ